MPEVSSLASPATLLLVCSAGVALYMALQHGLAFWGRRSERSHLWVALWSVAAVAVMATRLMQYSAHSVSVASVALRLTSVGAIICAVGAIAAMRALAGEERHPHLHLSLLPAHAVLFYLTLFTDLVYRPTGALVTDWTGRSYYWVDAGPLVGVHAVWGLALLGYATWVIGSSETLPAAERRLLLIGMASYVFPGLWDTAIAMKLFDGPLLFDYSFLVVAITLSLLLARRFDALQTGLEIQVRQRTFELQQANLALGASLAEAEQAAETKGRFLANLSHEIRTPLNGLLASTQMLLETPLDAEGQRLAAVASRSAMTMKELVDDVLDLAAVESGDVAVRPQLVDPTAVLAEIVRQFQDRAAQDGTSLVLISRAGSIPPIVVDPLRLRQITGNLVSNAVKFASGGRIELRIAGVNREQGSMVRVEVRDDGPGLDELEQVRVFEAFHGTGVTHTTTGNTGLGLPIARELARRLGGHLGVDSAPGQGSTFWFELPVGDTSLARPLEGEPAAASAAIPRTLGRGKRLLVAEDLPLNQEVARLTLSRLGYECDMADDGHAAVQRALTGKYDAVLMDVRMPGMDGLEATRRIRAAGCKIVIIATTANAFESDRRAAEEAGVSGFLSKPLELSALSATLFRLLGSGEPDEGAPEPSPPPADPQARWMAMFIEDANSRVQTLLGATRDQDAKLAASAAHAIRGAALNLGLSEVAELCQAMESEARVGGVPSALQINRLVRQLEAAEATSRGGP